jgi:hypothetical protein
LCSDQTTSRCSLLLSLRTTLEALKGKTERAKKVLEGFGPLERNGPFNVLDLNASPDDVSRHGEEMLANLPLLPSFAALARMKDKANTFGLERFLDRCTTPGISSDNLVDTFRAAVAYQQARELWESNTNLKFFDSHEHERLRIKFQQDDEKQLKHNRHSIISTLSNSTVDEGYKGKTAGEHTELALLNHELGKKKKHLPIRKLVTRAGRSMQDLCPCWMMTPLAVAQFLSPGNIKFDIIIMDEASQINPEDAWGAIARGGQLIVVGDHKQMPPTDFFESTFDVDVTEVVYVEIDGGRSKSVLEAAMPSLLNSSLLWHYRSRHETLIAPANSFSYSNRLILFPHPHRTNPELGIRYKYVEGATTTTGKVTNVEEAKVVATRVKELVLREYAKPLKNRMSIGVVTMNLPQQDCLDDLLDKMREEDGRFDRALGEMSDLHLEEPFFVRNLENIQGDERDIIIIPSLHVLVVVPHHVAAESIFLNRLAHPFFSWVDSVARGVPIR